MNQPLSDKSKIVAVRVIPSDAILEFLFHFYLITSMLMLPYGFHIPYSGGVMLFGLAALSLIIVNWRQVDKTFLFLVFAVASLHILIQALIYQLPVLSYYVRPFIFWLPLVLVIYPLTHRPGFIKRLVTVMFIIALLLLPFLRFIDAPTVQRLGLLAGSGIDNPNDFSAWLAFCALVFLLWSWKVSSPIKRWFLFILIFIAVLIMAQTVSRSAVIALLTASLFGLRSVPRKQWPLVIVGSIIVVIMSELIPIVQQSVTRYELRLFEDTGRTVIWRIAISAIQDNPILGYGVDRIGAARNIRSVLGDVIPISSPHNGIILLWLSSGIFPVIPFLMVWYLALQRGWRVVSTQNSPHIDPLPLLVFAFLMMITSNINFMAPWSIAALGYCFAIPKVYNSTVQSQVARYH